VKLLPFAEGGLGFPTLPSRHACRAICVPPLCSWARELRSRGAPHTHDGLSCAICRLAVRNYNRAGSLLGALPWLVRSLFRQIAQMTLRFRTRFGCRWAGPGAGGAPLPGTSTQSRTRRNWNPAIWDMPSPARGCPCYAPAMLCVSQFPGNQRIGSRFSLCWRRGIFLPHTACWSTITAPGIGACPIPKNAFKKWRNASCSLILIGEIRCDLLGGLGTEGFLEPQRTWSDTQGKSYRERT